MALSTQPYKGTRDFYPEDMLLRSWMFGQMRKVIEGFGYQEYDGPMLEPFELYAAKTGEEIVNQQLYWLIDRGERKLAVRPEMTPTLARMVAAKLHEVPKPIRWYSIPNLWRYERPQRGRLREHWQLNVDVLGGDPVLADAEILTLALEMIRAFGGEEFVTIRVNNRRLMDRFFEKRLGLAAETALAATKAIDARAKIGEGAYKKWLQELGITDLQCGEMEDFFQAPFAATADKLPCDGVEDLKRLFDLLEESGVAAKVIYDPTVLRGLDYYTGTVFEMFDTSPENRRAMFGGGRYDNLVGMFGKDRLSGVGFGMGDVTMQNFLETHKLIPELPAAVDVFVALPSLSLRRSTERVARELRLSGLRVVTPLEAGGFGAHLKQATRHGARFAVLLGEAELAQEKYILKNLKTGEQSLHSLEELAQAISRD